MIDTFISFYMKASRVRVSVKCLREIGKPERVCFMISDGGDKLLLAPHKRKDFISHKVPKEVYAGTVGLEVCSKKLCLLIARMYNWNTDCSYRIPGKAYGNQSVAIFDLKDAKVIKQNIYF